MTYVAEGSNTAAILCGIVSIKALGRLYRNTYRPQGTQDPGECHCLWGNDQGRCPSRPGPCSLRLVRFGCGKMQWLRKNAE